MKEIKSLISILLVTSLLLASCSYPLHDPTCRKEGEKAKRIRTQNTKSQFGVQN